MTHPTRATIITIGDEILIGQIVDTNTSWIAQELTKIGIPIYRKTSVGDDECSIFSILEACVIHSNIIIITGGLGPTQDDKTKDVLCKFCSTKLVENEAVLSHVQEFFKKRNREFLDVNRGQALVPENAEVLFNEVGTAPGLLIEKNDVLIFALPGVPFEMKHLMTKHVIPKLQSKYTSEHVIQEHILTVGEGESFVAEKIKDIESSFPPHLTLAYLPSIGSVKLRILGKGSNISILNNDVKKYSNQIAERLSYCVVAREDITLNQVVVQKLKEKNKTIATIESCTGGALGSLITDIPGSSEIFKGGWCVYSNDFKESILHVPSEIISQDGAVSEACVLHLAKNGRILAGSDIAISISGILGPSGGHENKPIGTVWIGIATENGEWAKCFQFQYNNRERNKIATLTMAQLQILKTLEEDA